MEEWLNRSTAFAAAIGAALTAAGVFTTKVAGILAKKAEAAARFREHTGTVSTSNAETVFQKYSEYTDRLEHRLNEVEAQMKEAALRELECQKTNTELRRRIDKLEWQAASFQEQLEAEKAKNAALHRQLRELSAAVEYQNGGGGK